MSLSDRLNRMESAIRQQGQQLAELAQLVKEQAQLQQDMVDAMPEDEDEDEEPERDLDGNVYGRERDQSQSLDG